MHRTNRVLKWVAGGLAAVSLAHGPAPPQPPGGDQPPAEQPRGKSNALIVAINGTKRLAMTPKRVIRSVINEKENIARVQAIVDDPGAVLVVGLQAGSTKITMTDNAGVKEEVEIIVQ